MPCGPSADRQPGRMMYRWRPWRTARPAGVWTKRGPGTSRSRGQRRSARRGPLAGKGDPAGCPRQASPAWAIALLGGALAGSGPGTSPCVDGLSLTSGMVVPSTLGVQTVRTTMAVRRRLPCCKTTRRSASKRLLCPCFGHSRGLWFFGLLRTFLNGWTELAGASWACSWRWQRRPPPQPHQGHGGGALSSGMTALDVPPEPGGRQRGPHSGCVLL
jgi:hypothetical protein